MKRLTVQEIKDFAKDAVVGRGHTGLMTDTQRTMLEILTEFGANLMRAAEEK